MCLCLTVIKNRLLETWHSMISNPNKTKVCKLSISYFYDFSKYCIEFGTLDASQRQNS